MGGVPIIGDILAPDEPEVPELPEPPPPAPTEVDPGVIAARQKQRRRAASVTDSTVKTSKQGLEGKANTTKKSLLGN